MHRYVINNARLNAGNCRRRFVAVIIIIIIISSSSSIGCSRIIIIVSVAAIVIIVVIGWRSALAATAVAKTVVRVALRILAQMKQLSRLQETTRQGSDGCDRSEMCKFSKPEIWKKNTRHKILAMPPIASPTRSRLRMPNYREKIFARGCTGRLSAPLPKLASQPQWKPLEFWRRNCHARTVQP